MPDVSYYLVETKWRTSHLSTLEHQQGRGGTQKAGCSGGDMRPAKEGI